MKKFITIALAAVIAISANAKKVNTAVFNSVKVNAPVHLVIVPSREYSVNVSSRETGLASAISRDGRCEACLARGYVHRIFSAGNDHEVHWCVDLH